MSNKSEFGLGHPQDMLLKFTCPVCGKARMLEFAHVTSGADWCQACGHSPDADLIGQFADTMRKATELCSDLNLKVYDPFHFSTSGGKRLLPPS